LLTAQFGVRVRNISGQDCHVQSQLASAPAVLANVQPGTTNKPGFIDSWVNGNLPTQNADGTYLELNESVSRVFPVVAGSNTVYLNGSYNGYSPSTYDCQEVFWGPISMAAVFAEQSPAATLTAP
jgi:hypothetical protein